MHEKNFFIKLFPRFWDYRFESQPYQPLFNYGRIWVLSVVLLLAVSLIPLSVLFLADFQLSLHVLKSEAKLRTVRQTSNARRTLAYFIDERRAALRFIVKETKYEGLTDEAHLKEMLRNLKFGFGGFVDLGVLLPSGKQIVYAGPFNLRGRNYADKDWFVKTVKNGMYISDVFLGYRKEPHMIIAVKGERSNGEPFILRGTLDIKKLIEIITGMELSKESDAFVINQEGILQTPSRFYGKILNDSNLPVPPYSDYTKVFETKDKKGENILIGYAYIENSPYILVIVRHEKYMMNTWVSLRNDLLWFFVGSISVILIVILGISTYMVNKVFYADQTRMRTLHRMEHTNRLASIGRLAAGVAHEINNPLAVINEKAGLVKDIFTLSDKYKEDPKVTRSIDSIISSVERCGAITKQLLGFARHLEVEIQKVDIRELVSEVLSFLKKESEYRNIIQDVKIDDDVPQIVTDRGKLQQVFINLINNAYQAIEHDGRLTIRANVDKPGWVGIEIRDTGCGIPEKDIKKIFEPFFSTKKNKGGTGLGLSITYGLVQKIGGRVNVQSELGKGTVFKIKLPIRMEGN
ncbi:MAG: sensor histidine kinase [Thermodesulfobacteriota bacterium]